MSASNYLEAWIDSESAGQQTLAVKIVYIDINDGYLTDGILFSQIVYWSGKTKEGKYRAQTLFGGHRWIVKEADEWYAECRIKDSTARESLRRIVARGLVIKEVHRHHEKACTHLRINAKVFEERIKLALGGKPMPDCQKTAKRRKGSGLPKTSKAELPKSSNVYTEITRSESQEDSSEGVPSSESAKPAPQVFAALSEHQNQEARHLLTVLQSGKYVGADFSFKVISTLLEAGLIERCKCGLRDALALKGQGDNGHEAAKLDELKAGLAPLAESPAPTTNPAAFYYLGDNTPMAPNGYLDLFFGAVGFTFYHHIVQDGSNATLCGLDARPMKRYTSDLMGTKIHDCETCQGKLSISKSAAPAPTPAALPDVPEGYEAVYSNIQRHYISLQSKALKTTCGKAFGKYHILKVWIPGIREQPEQCPDCAAKAAARPPTGKGKAGKPAIYSSSPLFDAIASFSFKASEKADVKAVAGRVAKIRAALANYVCEKLGSPDPTPEQIEKVVNRVKELGTWYDHQCKGCTRPNTPETFMTWYLKLGQSANGTAAGVEDCTWMADDGHYMKREKGKLFRLGDTINDWREVKA